MFMIPKRSCANQWKYADFDGDEKLDLIVGIEDWSEYGWDDTYDARGRWMRGPLHGVVYWLRNQGTNAKPDYAKPVKLEAGGKPIDTFGMPSPNLADFDGDGDLDLLCGEFVDGLTYFENTGSRRQPVYARGRRVVDGHNKPILMNLEMIVPVAVDWDNDGDVDLVVGDEDGRVALIEHTGKVVDGLPRFEVPAYFRQQAGDVKFGALVTPCSVDWDGDGDEDLVCGNSSGVIGLIENLDGGNPRGSGGPATVGSGGCSDPDHGRAERVDSRPVRSQVGVYDFERGRLGPRRPARSHRQFDLGQGRLVSATPEPAPSRFSKRLVPSRSSGPVLR